MVLRLVDIFRCTSNNEQAIASFLHRLVFVDSARKTCYNLSAFQDESPAGFGALMDRASVSNVRSIRQEPLPTSNERRYEWSHQYSAGVPSRAHNMMYRKSPCTRMAGLCLWSILATTPLFSGCFVFEKSFMEVTASRIYGTSKITY
jgi:hypothetical protein